MSYENEEINLSHNDNDKLYKSSPNLHNSDITRTKTSSPQNGMEENYCANENLYSICEEEIMHLQISCKNIFREKM